MPLSPKAEQWRKSLVRKAKTMQKRVLVMSDEDYQTKLLVMFGKESTADLTIDELKTLNGELDELAGVKRGNPQKKLDGQSAKIWALWQELHKLGAVRDPSEAALNAFIKSRCRASVDSYKWLNTAKASDAIEILKQWKKRIERKTEASNAGRV